MKNDKYLYKESHFRRDVASALDGTALVVTKKI